MMMNSQKMMADYHIDNQHLLAFDKKKYGIKLRVNTYNCSKDKINILISFSQTILNYKLIIDYSKKN
jgi:hypothetical protein